MQADLKKDIFKNYFLNIVAQEILNIETRNLDKKRSSLMYRELSARIECDLQQCEMNNVFQGLELAYLNLIQMGEIKTAKKLAYTVCSYAYSIQEYALVLKILDQFLPGSPSFLGTRIIANANLGYWDEAYKDWLKLDPKGHVYPGATRNKKMVIFYRTIFNFIFENDIAAIKANLPTLAGDKLVLRQLTIYYRKSIECAVVAEKLECIRAELMSQPEQNEIVGNRKLCSIFRQLSLNPHGLHSAETKPEQNSTTAATELQQNSVAMPAAPEPVMAEEPAAVHSGSVYFIRQKLKCPKWREEQGIFVERRRVDKVKSNEGAVSPTECSVPQELALRLPSNKM